MAALKHLLVAASLYIFQANSRGVQIPIHDADYDSSSLIHDILVQNEVIGDVLSDFEPSISLAISYPKSHETVHLGNDIPVSSVSDPPVFEFHTFNGPHLSTSRRRRVRQSSDSQASQSDASHDYDESEDYGGVPPENLTYTLALTDPDAKSRSNPIWSEMAHWIVTNLTLLPPSPLKTASDPYIHPFSMDSLTAIKPSVLLPYLPPGPPPKTGSHRYVFVLLAGSAQATAKLVPPKSSKEGRQHWGYGKERTGVEKWARESGLKVVGANFFVARDEEQ